MLVNFTCDRNLVDRVDRVLIPREARRSPGATVSRASVLRWLLIRELETAEAEACAMDRHSDRPLFQIENDGD